MKRGWILPITLAFAFVSVHSFFQPDLCYPQDYKSVRADITFGSDWNVLEFWFGTNPYSSFGFRSNSLKFTSSSSAALSHFSVTPHRIELYKLQQYDTSPVSVSVIVDMPKNAGEMTFAVVTGRIGSIEANVYGVSGTLLGQLKVNGTDFADPWDYKKFTFGAPTSVDSYANEPVPNELALEQNYPNPFNPRTSIEYSIKSHQRVTITVFNQLGQVVRTLVDEVKMPGEYAVAWDGKNENAVQLPSGAYLSLLQAGNFRQLRKMTLLR